MEFLGAGIASVAVAAAVAYGAKITNEPRIFWGLLTIPMIFGAVQQAVS